MSVREAEVVWLAALLHDLGKFWQRTFPGRTAPHEEYGRRFVEDEFRGYFSPCGGDLAHAIAHHHRPRVERSTEKLVILADRLSAREREREERQREEPSRTALLAVLSRPPIAPEGREQGFRLGPLPVGGDSQAAPAFFPAAVATVSPEEYASLWRAFHAEFTALAGRRGYQSADFETIVALLRKYTSRMPAATPWEGEPQRTVPDISLYDHLKTTAAIAACLERVLAPNEMDRLLHARPDAEQQPLCALIKGDISGTQSFLYLLTASGAARGLRGRSFYLQLLTETVARWLLRRLGLPITNLLFAGGGHFYVLAPYREMERLAELRRQIAARMWKIHRGDLFLALDHVGVSAQDFAEGGFAAKWAEVSQKLQQAKQRKGAELGEAMMGLFESQEVGGTQEICRVCHGEGRIEPDWEEPENPERRKCRRCRSFEKLGAELRNPTHLVLFDVAERDPPDEPDWFDALGNFGIEARLCQHGEIASPPVGASGGTVLALDTGDFLLPSQALEHWGDLAPSYDFRLLAGATPRKQAGNGEVAIADFSDLARASDGVKWLGVLRMDVDDLGDLFKNRLKSHATIARVSAVSESLRLFFEGWVPQRCREYNRFDAASGTGEDRLYLIYAGGDDLFLVGAWSALPELARTIREDFRRFVGGDHVGLSAGIAIEHQKFPLYQLAEAAKHWLDDVAKEYRRCHGDREISKDAICFLRTPRGWERFAQVADWKHRLQEMLRPGDGSPGVARALLTRLAQVHSLYQRNRERQQRRVRRGEISDAEIQEWIVYARWQWQLVYHLGRFADRYPQFQQEIGRLQQAIVNDKLIEVLGLLARWTELLTREDES